MFRWQVFLLLSSFCICHALFDTPSRPLVNTNQGLLRGRRTGEFFRFEAIPYALPPVGKWAFKAPKPPEPWQGEREAGRGAGPPCHQRGINFQLFQGKFDCLYLNVYTPKLPINGSYADLPVMIWIYGGGFTLGFASPYTYGPDYLVHENVVVVTFNYRVGPYGFLGLNTPEYSGNMGLKDQVMAMRWVRNNIAAFGGDPQKVTLFGQSAGGVSVHLHMMSPMSRGLFQKAISQSGSVLMHWAHQKNSRSFALRLADAMGCLAIHNKSIQSDQHIIECLTEANPKTVTEQAEQIFLADRYRIPFVPTIEPENTPDAFLTQDPIYLVQNGLFDRNIPYIMGANSAEGILMLPVVTFNSTYVDLVKNNPRLLLPLNIEQNLINDGMDINKVGNAVKAFYFGNETYSRHGFEEFQTDISFAVSMIHTARLHVKYSSAPVYMYDFSFSGFKSLPKFVLGGINYKGACHGDDVFYLFRFFYLPEMLERGTVEGLMSLRLARLWSQFAKTGSPTVGQSNISDPLVPVRWEPYSLARTSYLQIDQDLNMRFDLRRTNVRFWDQFPLGF